MKRLFALILAAATLLLALPAGTVASTAAAVNGASPAVTVSRAEGTAGSEVKVTLSLSGNPGIVAFRFELRYDTDALELTDVRYPALLGSPATGGRLTANPFIVSWHSPAVKNESANGVFAELTFRIKEGAAPGDRPLSVGYDPVNLFDENWNEVRFATADGAVGVLCDHRWDDFGIECGRCGQTRMRATMQERPSAGGSGKDFRILLEGADEIFGNADSVMLTLEFLDAEGKPAAGKASLKVYITVVYRDGVYTADGFHKPSAEGYCIGGAVVTGIPADAGVKSVTAGVTFVKDGREKTYALGSAGLS